MMPGDDHRDQAMPGMIGVAGAPAFDRSAAVTRSLLGWGVVVGPFYLIIGFLQGLLRPGFSFARHPLSVLVNGDYGWVQSANFALSGLMVIAAAFGMGRILGPGMRATPWTLGAYGACIALSAMLPADPVDGFPLGTPIGPPASITTVGFMHFAVGALGFVCFGASALLAARALARHGDRAMSRLSLAAGIALLVSFFSGFSLPSPVVGIWIAVLVGWTWLAAFSLYLYRISPNPNCQ